MIYLYTTATYREEFRAKQITNTALNGVYAHASHTNNESEWKLSGLVLWCHCVLQNNMGSQLTGPEK